jgi:hypothetical protein
MAIWNYEDIWNYMSQFLDLSERLLCAEVCLPIRKLIMKNSKWYNGLSNHIDITEISHHLIIRYATKILQIENPIFCICICNKPAWRKKKYIVLNVMHRRYENNLHGVLKIRKDDLRGVLKKYKGTGLRYKIIREKFSNRDCMTTTSYHIDVGDIPISEYETYMHTDLQDDKLRSKIPNVCLNDGYYHMYQPKRAISVISPSIQCFTGNGIIKIIGKYTGSIKWTWLYKNEELIPLFILDRCEEKEIHFIFDDMTNEEIKQSVFFTNSGDKIDKVTVNGIKVSIYLCENFREIILIYISEYSTIKPGCDILSLM